MGAEGVVELVELAYLALVSERVAGYQYEGKIGGTPRVVEI